MNPFVFGLHEPEHGWLDASVHELLQVARQEAALRGMLEVSLEHCLLAALQQNEPRVVSLLVDLGLDTISLRERILEKLGPSTLQNDQHETVVLSLHVQLCVDLAVAAVHSTGISFVLPEQLLLCLLSAQWQMALDKVTERLRFLSRWDSLLPICTELAQQERRMMFYTQNLIHFLSSAHEASISFAQVSGFEQAKQELRALITAVEATASSASNELMRSQEVLLSGALPTIARQLAEATAFALGARLFTLAFGALVTMCIPFTTYKEVKRSKEQAFTVREPYVARHIIAFSQRILQHFFQRLRYLSPCVLLIEDIDGSEYTDRVRVDEVYDQLLSSLFTELEQLRSRGHLILATAVTHIDLPLQRLSARGLLPRLYFEHRLLLSQRDQKQNHEGFRNCSCCLQAVNDLWMYCAYCSNPLAPICIYCGSIHKAGEQNDCRIAYSHGFSAHYDH